MALHLTAIPLRYIAAGELWSLCCKKKHAQCYVGDLTDFQIDRNFHIKCFEKCK
jgi:hypothetical protein